MTRVGINGFGRIGRQFYRAARDFPGIEVVAVNDLTDPATLAHLLVYDSNYGTLEADVSSGDGEMMVDGKAVKVLAERDPGRIAWRDLGVKVVVESTGRFTNAEHAVKHRTGGGAAKVIISAPGKGEDACLVLGVNEDAYDPECHHVISMASCTTNCLAPVARVLDDGFGIVRGLMTTVHAYTSDQMLLDGPHQDLRRARAAALSIVPTSTGAAAAIGKVLPRLAGKLNGFAMRVPTSTVSVVDLVVELEREVTAEEINRAFRQAAAGPLDPYLKVSDVPLVSVDFKGNTASAVVDGLSTMAVGSLAKVIAWYDNEAAYARRLVDLVRFLAERGL
ncbi:MAG: type I glyceraldehyde-3-phosphate dehydrogenase [bacterium]|nr:type I glyceraldehyde-3-phosphate dehydrogenase [bacterium]